MNLQVKNGTTRITVFSYRNGGSNFHGRDHLWKMRLEKYGLGDCSESWIWRKHVEELSVGTTFGRWWGRNVHQTASRARYHQRGAARKRPQCGAARPLVDLVRSSCLVGLQLEVAEAHCNSWIFKHGATAVLVVAARREEFGDQRGSSQKI